VNVTVKLFANLQQYAPDGVKAAQPFEVEVPDGGTIEELLDVLGIPKRETKVAFVNGRGRAHGYRLQPDDEVGIFPPVGGG
jgi:molybdopterin converting factor small subunit